MNYTETDNDLIVSVEGRIDTNNSDKVLEDIRETRKQAPEKSLVLDFNDLDYISSFGLRLMLTLQKEENGFRIINASNEVYDVFEMTGLTSVLPIKRALREISIEDTPVIGEGATGKTYRINDEQIVKVFAPNVQEHIIQQERDLAQKAFLQGINTAIPFDEVKVGDSLGIVYEAIDSQSIYQTAANDLSKVEELAKEFGQLMKESHKIELLDSDSYTDQKDIYLNLLNKYGDYLPEEDFEKISKLIERIPYSNNFSHGDFHPGNVLLQNNNMILIDMLTVGKGLPIFDWIGYYSCSILPDKLLKGTDLIEQYYPVPSEVVMDFYNKAFDEYYKDEDPETLKNISQVIQLLAPFRVGFMIIDNFGLDKDNPFIQLYLNEIHQMFNGIDVDELDLSFLNHE